jgi:hypothetical protein
VVVTEVRNFCVAPPSIEDIQSAMKTSLEEEKPTAENQTEVPELHVGLVDISSVPPPPPLTGRDLSGSDLIGRQLETVSNRSDTSGKSRRFSKTSNIFVFLIS